MNHILLIITTLIVGFSSCKPNESTAERTGNTEQIQQTAQQTINQPVPEKHVKIEQRSDLSFLSEMNGQYPYETNLLENEPMKTRLETIMGGKYIDFLQRMEVQTPIRVDGDIVLMSGFMKHSGGIEEAALVVDVAQNLIWVLTLENGKDMSIFKDDRDVRMPDLFIRKIQELTN